MQPEDSLPRIEDYVAADVLAETDQFDQWQLAKVITVCQNANSLSDAGRQLFDRSRMQKSSVNDSHRLRQYLATFGLTADRLLRS